MPMQPPDDSIGQILLNWSGAAAAALAGLLWRNQSEKISELAGRLEKSMDEHRSDLVRIFDKLDSNAQRSDSRHIELMSAIHTGLEGKADK